MSDLTPLSESIAQMVSNLPEPLPKAERDHLLSAAYGSDEDTVPPAMPAEEIAAKLETGEMQGVATKSVAPADDLDANPFAATPDIQVQHLMAELATAQQRIERQDAELRDYRRLVDDLLSNQTVSPIRRKEVCTVQYSTVRPETVAASNKELAAKLSDGWTRFDSTFDDGVFYIILVRDEPASPAPSHLIDIYAEADAVDDPLAESRAFWQQAARQKLTAAERHELLVNRAMSRAQEAIARQSVVAFKQLGQAS